MEYTGERVLAGGDDNEPREIVAEHLARYRFVIPFIKDKKVLDIACGTGYGSELMAAGGAKIVVGGDIDGETIKLARANYQKENLSFEKVNAMAMPFGDGSFEAVVSFETIEHLDKAEKFVNEAARVLAPGGRLILSTPNRKATKQLAVKNLFHLKEFDQAELLALLGAQFKEIKIYGQRPIRSLTLKQKLIRKSYLLYAKIKYLEFLKRWFSKNLRQSIGKEIDGLGEDSEVEEMMPGKEYLYLVAMARKK
ncbi:hypothetical protein A3E04_02720 [Candidatus Kuenenbacteria bacterium RIFCSPHIGHO2_12_FULL_42_14]|uniref:Methyltransferase type 11 domain-containing protein n=1 Tax=Candidatus Kuenenbacteria bacterium RIFCSPHIGHO2_12_FULL_42_14 TaxID=1798563 RepID=A0A1F6GK69_9BACT|nr:MAG: hypothetical protein A3E04_02720 [Candidatus Kuenenbacteria bacterium RIFCSPHIGHO2_12_FULL_42_14]